MPFNFNAIMDLALSTPTEETFLEYASRRDAELKKAGKIGKGIGSSEERSKVVSASGLGCPRKAFLSKKHHAWVEEQRSLKSKMILERGEVVETYVSWLLDRAGLEFEEQIHLEIPTSNGVMFIAHPDVRMIDPDEPKKKILVEIKSTGNMPYEIYPEHKRQILSQCWAIDQLTENTGVEGHVLYINIYTGQSKVFSYDWAKSMEGLILPYIEVQAAAILNGQEPMCERGILCDFCPFLGETEVAAHCPAFTMNENKVIDMPDEVKKLLIEQAELKNSTKAYEKRLKTVEDQLKQLASNVRQSGFSGMTDGQTLLALSARSRSGLDEEAWKNADSASYEAYLRAKDIYQSSSSYDVLTTNKVKITKGKTAEPDKTTALAEVKKVAAEQPKETGLKFDF